MGEINGKYLEKVGGHYCTQSHGSLEYLFLIGHSWQSALRYFQGNTVYQTDHTSHTFYRFY